MYDFHGIAVFQSHFIVILARYDSTVQLDGDAVCTIFLVGQVSEQVLAGRFDVFAVDPYYGESSFLSNEKRVARRITPKVVYPFVRPL